jgi:bacillithiol system protein YtxJ
MKWIDITSLEQLEEIKERSNERAQVIFKHSTRCSISSMAKGRLERSQIPQDADFYHLDLIRHRNISAKIAEDFNVHHESPQILVIKKGECIFDDSHYNINMDDIHALVSSQ